MITDKHDRNQSISYRYSCKECLQASFTWYNVISLKNM
jgi:hypothetical protein